MVPNCSSGHDTSIGIQRDLPGSTFEVDLSRSLRTILLFMTSGDLSIDLTQKFICKSCRSFNEKPEKAEKAPLPDSEPF